MTKKEWDRFQDLRQKKVKMSLRNRLTLLVGGVLLVSFFAAFGMTKLIDWLFPIVTHIPQWIQLSIFALVVAMLATHFLSNIFFDPIRDLRVGMQEIADGHFDTRLQTRSSSLEIQELVAGFNMMAQELESTEILQTDFVSNVSHEFKTPINAIEGYTTLLQSTENIDEVEEGYIEKILANTRRLSSLVSHILLLSKFENQSIQPVREAYRLDEQIREAVVSLESAWEPKTIEWDVELDAITYVGNKNTMHHVWSNLLGNAVKFSPSGGCVSLRLWQADGVVNFTVEDEGPGLSAEAEKHLFDKFYQADTSHKGEGNGLGLALVKRILTVEGGTVVATNRPRGGCCFTLTLPTENKDKH